MEKDRTTLLFETDEESISNITQLKEVHGAVIEAIKNKSFSDAILYTKQCIEYRLKHNLLLFKELAQLLSDAFYMSGNLEEGVSYFNSFYSYCIEKYGFYSRYSMFFAYGLMGIYTRANDTRKATNYAKEAYIIAEGCLGPYNETTIFNLYDYANSLYLDFNYEEASSLFAECLDRAIYLFGENDSLIIAILIDYGNTEYKIENYDKAYTLLTKAIELYLRKYGRIDNGLKLVLSNLVDICNELERFKEAEYYVELYLDNIDFNYSDLDSPTIAFFALSLIIVGNFEKTITLLTNYYNEAELGDEDLQLMRYMFSYYYTMVGQKAEAKKWALEYLENDTIDLNNLNERDQMDIATPKLIMLLYAEEYDEFIKHNINLYKLKCNIGEGEDLDSVHILNSIGNVYFIRAEYKKTLRFEAIAYSILKKHNLKDSNLEYMTMLHLAGSHFLLNDLELSINLFQECYDIATRTNLFNGLYSFITLFYIAIINAKINNNIKAKQYYLECIDKSKDLEELSNDFIVPIVSDSISSVSILSYIEGNNTEALEYANFAYSYNVEHFGEDKDVSISSLLLLARLNKLTGNLVETEKQLGICYSIKIEQQSNLDILSLNIIYELAMLKYEKKEFSEAIKLFTKCYNYRKEILGTLHKDTLDTLLGLASAYYDMGDENEANKIKQEYYSYLASDPNYKNTSTSMHAMKELVNMYKGEGRQKLVDSISKQFYDKILEYNSIELLTSLSLQTLREISNPRSWT